jgi:hypothetical protein
MDAFDLIWTYDAVGERSAVLEHEYGIAISAFLLASTADTTVIHHHAAIKGVTGSNSLHGAKSRRARRGGKITT